MLKKGFVLACKPDLDERLFTYELSPHSHKPSTNTKYNIQHSILITRPERQDSSITKIT